MPSDEQKYLDFIATITHELRTPLTSIGGFADTLLSSSDKLTDEQKMHFYKIIKNQSVRLTRLVENLLRVSQNSNQKTIFKAIDFSTAIENILALMQIKTHSTKLNIQKNLPPMLADADKLEQIMINLLDNAINYSEAKSVIEIKAFNSQKSVIIEVIDNGEGVPDKFLDKLFDKFSRHDNPMTRKTEGSGLGLYISKNLAQSMNAELIAEKNHKKGMTFRLKLPVFDYEKQTNKIKAD